LAARQGAKVSAPAGGAQGLIDVRGRSARQGSDEAREPILRETGTDCGERSIVY
jgi:hypothetical protein